MPSELEQRILNERAQLLALDSTLDDKRTPYMKRQLRFAGHMLDDATTGLSHAARANPSNAAMWRDFAQMNIQIAAQLREKVRAAVDKYGGPEHITEIDG